MLHCQWSGFLLLPMDQVVTISSWDLVVFCFVIIFHWCVAFLVSHYDFYGLVVYDLLQYDYFFIAHALFCICLLYVSLCWCRFSAFSKTFCLHYLCMSFLYCSYRYCYDDIGIHHMYLIFFINILPIFVMHIMWDWLLCSSSQGSIIVLCIQGLPSSLQTANVDPAGLIAYSLRVSVLFISLSCLVCKVLW